MKMIIAICAVLAGLAASATATAAVGLDTCVDKNASFDLRALACAQLADTYQEHAKP